MDFARGKKAERLIGPRHLMIKNEDWKREGDRSKDQSTCASRGDNCVTIMRLAPEVYASIPSGDHDSTSEETRLRDAMNTKASANQE